MPQLADCCCLCCVRYLAARYCARESDGSRLSLESLRVETPPVYAEHDVHPIGHASTVTLAAADAAFVRR